MTILHIDVKKHCRVLFGSYVEAHYEPNITNNMYPRTHKCIELRPTGKIKWTQKAFFLNSEIFLKRRDIIPIIASYRIIKIVEDWGKKSRRDKFWKVIEIRNRNKELFDWENKETEE